MAAHAEHSPSSSDIWLNCPAYIQVVRDLPKRTGRDAELGTAAHELLEICLRLGADPVEFIGATFNGFTADTTMVDGVGLAVDYVRSYVAENPDTTYIPERRLEIHLGDAGVTFGTSDITMWNRQAMELVVADYKNGVGMVDPVENTQLLLYAIGCLQDLLRTHPDLHPKDVSVLLVIIQPNARHSDGPVRHWRTDAEYVLSKFHSRCRSAIHASRDPSAPRIAGDHCTWCPDRGQCAALALHNLKRAASDFDDLPVEPVQAVEVLRQKPLKDTNILSPEQVVELLDAVPLFDAWISGLKAHALNLATHGNLPGKKLVEGISRRKWNVPDDQVTSTLTSMGLDIDTAAPRKPLSPSKAEKCFPRNKAAKEQLRSIIIKPKGRLVLANASDPRPTATVTEFPDDLEDDFPEDQEEA